EVVAAVRASLPAEPPRIPAEPRSAAPSPTASSPTASSPTVSGSSSGPVGAFAGKVAVVTGAGHGLGKVIATRLAEGGATVVINAFHAREAGEATARSLVAAGHRAIAVWGSVANEEHVAQLFDRVEGELGGVDLLVCNASDGRLGPFAELTGRDWDRAFRTNVSGHFQCALRASASMARRGGGSIVTLSTVGAHRYVRGFGSQGVVKAAVEAMTRYLACELAPSGIRVNCVAAGPIYGELLDKFTDPTAIPTWEAITPGGSLCTEDEVARVVAFVLSDDAVAFNGAVIPVDRGMSSHVDGRLELPTVVPLASRVGQGRAS
ncbi:MAG: SDR family oxidoreductase, partial [Myxococcota bacterium]